MCSTEMAQDGKKTGPLLSTMIAADPGSHPRRRTLTRQWLQQENGNEFLIGDTLYLSN